MRKKYFKAIALLLSGMLAIQAWNHSFTSKADGGGVILKPRLRQ